MEWLNPLAGKTSRDPANPYTLEEVMASGLDMLQDTTTFSMRELHGNRMGSRNDSSTSGSAVKQEDVGGILASMKDIFEQQVQQAQQEQQHISALEKAFIEQQKTIMNFLQQQQQQIQAQQYNQYNTCPTSSGFGSVPKQMNAGRDNIKAAGKEGPEKKKDFKRGYTPYPSDSKEPTYKIRAPIQEQGNRAEVMERVMNMEVPITVGELVLLLKLRDDVKSKLALKQIAFGKKGKSRKQQFRYFFEEKPDEDEEETEGEETEQVFPFNRVEVEDIEGLPGGAIHISKLPFVGSFMVSTEMRNGVPAGSLVWHNLFLQYVNKAAECGEEPKAVYMAKDSQALCFVFLLVNRVKKLESLYDTGSQIVSMSEHIADRLELIYDPNIVINMQSANKQVEKSLGIAKNVPFLFGDIIVYLQVHIIWDPAYDILLERPFNILTVSTMFNNTEGG
ncbi:hypothetical protein ARMSODRAFT_1028039 [Armillaria solidipes]|uniref:Uncharacterized protein n=1 Tax=Armillaria solidipes TaxID=1076256 RepID=A0A2H3AIJ6_9AGAR|nr:hypothetical protein ARMSODRAFT_1028039 [Armillaria solidipes]